MTRYTNGWHRIGMLLTCALLWGGCANEPAATTQPTLPLSDLLLKIEATPRGIVMAVGDTQQLTLQARNILGDFIPIDDSVPVTYTSANVARVSVSPTGLLRAVSVTQAATAQPAPVRIIIRWKYGVVTRADSIYVMVTLPPAQPIVSISIQPSPYPFDSTWFGYGIFGKTLAVKGKTASGDSVTNLYAFLYTNRRYQFLSDWVNPATRSVGGAIPGKFWVYATASIYGVAFQDSLRWTALDPVDVMFVNEFLFSVNPAGIITSAYANGGTAFFAPCGTVKFRNTSTIPLTITFDDPSKTGVCVTGDQTGNITLPAMGTAGSSAIRKFPAAGLFTWTATRTDGVPLGAPLGGKILVRDHTYWDTVP